ncbi:MAG: 2-succinyl-6-hydroxy-2,4-cyclohexadiene-1-carboxylate synthase [Myxococcota bacterium]|nr:2-succinyl-6-hydroxy-2,4-cyclohexadiene-1-carboxylate synthase [Myxococcota bacterium]MDP6242150.1 2-succinyl-6-hydroxy-2,4-cyclohexadiene-1-carboxylate synthase [Myxococcota bacterium]MDP7073755.1 2-succinyl-6-hydroxy-2,4-cyclohexadiene-1-carboxylate synthase [Myxococcota bacterium]MDP7300117.1 2-succinyl-6-hydroxy-2,4-cyclohexadiene-1-carboxylate synthase [Myxococcota bacterium]MDP7432650.1 2-succinyl-6-hydroxy-2,4-cyclohexadiene-1-carboxylate synthase [Myxococcota bacterium]
MTIALHAKVEGVGAPVVVLHGFTGSSESMSGLVTGLRDRWRVMSLDLIGHGASPAPRDTAHYTMERCVDQVAATLDRLDTGPAHVIGYSMGGRSALALAAWRPESVRSAILVGASAGLASADARADRRRTDEALADRIEREGLEAFVDHWMDQPLFATQRRLGTESLARSRAQRLNNRPHGLANSLRSMGTGAQPPLHGAIGDIRVPVRIVVGERDRKFGAIANELAALLPSASVKTIPGAGHACHLEAPDSFLRTARDFLEDVDRRTAMPDPKTPMHAGAHS